MSDQLDLYQLVPAIYRIRDEERGRPLQALLRLIQRQADLVRLDIDDLYDDFFIETCAAWVVPYIGDLIGNTPLYEITGTHRADVAHTLHYRHGKGTPRILEQLARDVTGWPAHVVAFFELLAWTQNVNHVRLQPATLSPRRDPPPLPPPLPRLGPYSFERVGTVDVRNYEPLDRFDGAFDSIAHTPDVRPPGQSSGWMNVHNVGVFLWRLKGERVVNAAARRSAAHPFGFHVSPIGNPIALFHAPDPPPERRTLATIADVDAPIRPAQFYIDVLRNNGVYYGPSLRIQKDNRVCAAGEICCMDLAGWAQPEAGEVGVDVARGRITFAAGEEPQRCTVAYCYGFSGDLGGGTYDRALTLEEPDPQTAAVKVPGDHDTIGAAIVAALAEDAPRAIVTVADNRTYIEDLDIDLGAKTLIVQAENESRPVILGDVTVTGVAGSALTINGFLISGEVHVEGSLKLFHLLHSTLVPGRRLDEEGRPLESGEPSLRVDVSNSEIAISIERSIAGAIVAPSESLGLSIADSIVDSAGRDTRVAVLVSGNLQPMPALTSPDRRLAVSAGGAAPRIVALPAVPHDAGELAAMLREAIANVTAIAVDGLVLLFGDDGTPLHVSDAPGDPTATELLLDSAHARAIAGVLGMPRAAVTTAAGASVTVRVDRAAPSEVVVGGLHTDIAGAAATLRPAMNAAGAWLLDAGARLLMLPADNAAAVSFPSQANDAATLFALGFAPAAALAGSAAGDLAGPAARIDATTVFGRVHVRQLDASNSIFTERVMTERRQAGCVRFSYVPSLSVTPRRFRCQPDLVEAPPADAARERLRVAPRFTSHLYGDAAYAQLSLACAGEIRTGADDGAEMGAFHFLMQPQREANLRLRLDEYLPFGLEAGLIFVT